MCEVGIALCAFNVPNNFLPVVMEAFTWQNQLHWTFSYSPAHMGKDGGKDEEGPTLAKFIDNLKKTTKLLSEEGHTL